MAAPVPASHLVATLLKGVSRSFYLSIRLLPADLRAPVGLAYLLARATDTVADTAGVEAGRRRVLLLSLAQAIEQQRLAPAAAAELAAFTSAQMLPEEARLLERTGACIEALASLDEPDRADVKTVLRHIVRGQSLDLERIPGALPDAAALEEYTYLVAGSVGEFWTDVCARHVANYARLPHERMRELGRSFGCGLQLVNILRDAGEDLAACRGYVPAAERPRWLEAARSRLRDGLAYANAVEPRRIRAAVAVPALIGGRTLDLLEQAGDSALSMRVKVPRREVRRLLLRTMLTVAGGGTIRAGWDNRAR